MSRSPDPARPSASAGPRFGAGLACAGAVTLAMLFSRAALTAELTLPSSWDDRFLDGALADGRTRPVLAVLSFEVKAVFEGSGNLALSDVVTTELQRAGCFDLVEREKVRSILEEQALALTGVVDDSARAAEVGKLLGAEAVVFGNLSSASQETMDRFAFDVVRTTVRVDARAADTTTGKMVFAEAGTGVSEAKLVKSADGTLISGVVSTETEYVRAAAAAVQSLVERLAAIFPSFGFLVSFDGRRGVVDIGVERGLAAGMRMVIFRPVERLIHPVTKKYMGWRKVVFAQAEVITVEQGAATIEITKIAKGGMTPKVGDFAVLVR